MFLLFAGSGFEFDFSTSCVRERYGSIFKQTDWILSEGITLIPY